MGGSDDIQAETWMVTNDQPYEYPSRVRTAQKRESRTANPSLVQARRPVPWGPSNRGQECHTNPYLDQGAFWWVDPYYHLQTHQVPFYSQHKMNSFIISSTKLCYIKILIGEHNTGKWVHSHVTVASVNCQINCFCKSNIATQRKIHKDALILWPTNSIPGELIQGNNLAQ